MKRELKILASVFIISVLYTSAVGAAEIKFDRLDEENGKIFLSFSIVSYKSKDVIEALKRGIELKVLYDIEIVRKSSYMLFGKTVVVRKSIRRSVKYDYWNKAFVIRERGNKALFHSENSLLDSIFTVKRFLIEKKPLLGKGSRNYSLRVNAQLKSVKLYFPMNLVFKYIIGIWDFKTGWIVGPPLKSLR
jgi:hypothetical protein